MYSEITATWRIIKIVLVMVSLKYHVVSIDQKYNNINDSEDSDSRGVVVIIESRNHPLLFHLIKTVSESVPSRWSFHIFHSKRNIDALNDISKVITLSRNYYFTLLLDEDLSNVSKDYNALLTNIMLWKSIRAKSDGTHALIVQTDSITCKNNVSYFRRFLEYDLIGAPWKTDDKWVIQNNLSIPVGNGGFSLRNITSMLNILENEVWDGFTPEDVWFSKIMQQQPKYGIVAPLEVAITFAVESFMPTKHPLKTKDENAFLPYGVHAFWRYLSGTEFRMLMKYCPNAIELMRGSGGDKIYSSTTSMTLITSQLKLKLNQDATSNSDLLALTSNCIIFGIPIKCIAADYDHIDNPITSNTYNKNANNSVFNIYHRIQVAQSIINEDLFLTNSTKFRQLGTGCNRNNISIDFIIDDLSILYESVVYMVARGSCSFRSKVMIAMETIPNLSSVIIVYENHDELFPPSLYIPFTNSTNITYFPTINIPVVAIHLNSLINIISNTTQFNNNSDTSQSPQSLSLQEAYSNNTTIELIDMNIELIRGHSSLHKKRSVSEENVKGNRHDHEQRNSKVETTTSDLSHFFPDHFKQTTQLLSRSLLRNTCDFVVDDNNNINIVSTSGKSRTLERLARVAHKLPPFSTVAVPQSHLPAFFLEVLPLFQHPIILYTSDTFSDLSSPFPIRRSCNSNSSDTSEFHDMISHSLISHWYTDNWAISMKDIRKDLVDKITLIPIGLSDDITVTGGSGDRRVILEAIYAAVVEVEGEADITNNITKGENSKVINNMAYANFHHSGESYDWMNPACSTASSVSIANCNSIFSSNNCNSNNNSNSDTRSAVATYELFDCSGSRLTALRALATNPAVYFDFPRSPKDAFAFKRIQAFTFEISPHGNGLDCHRTYEALLLRRIPIVLSSPLDAMYTELSLPVIVLNNWEQLTVEYLAEQRSNMILKSFLFNDSCYFDVVNKLTVEWWIENMHRRQDSLRIL